MKYILAIGLLLFANNAFSQDLEFYVELDRDTILIGNTIQVKFTILNGNGDFQAPELEHLNLVAGPNVASSFSFMNGVSKQEMSYIYVIRPTELGMFIIPSAVLETEGETYMTPETSYLVLDNPDGIIEEDGVFSSKKHLIPEILEENEKKEDKLKRKLKRI